MLSRLFILQTVGSAMELGSEIHCHFSFQKRANHDINKCDVEEWLRVVGVGVADWVEEEREREARGRS